jgi:hypothetical protein
MFRYRALTPSGDMRFGRGLGDFFIDEVRATAQSIKTRLALWTNEWFLDITVGTAWSQFVGQRNAKATADIILRDRILGTFGVLGIAGWWSGLDPVTRLYAAGAVVDTIWGQLIVTLATTGEGGTFELDVSPLDSGEPLG